MNHHTDEYSAYAVIPPPQVKDIEGNRKYTRVVIDSKDRNNALFPRPNEYEITFDDDIDDVISAQLISADIPLPMYMINEYFNTLHVTMNGVTTAVELDRGDYDGSNTAFSTMIKAKLNALFPATFEVDYNVYLDNYTFRATVPFAIDFTATSNSLHQMLGFQKKVYTSQATGSAPFSNVIQSEFRRNLEFNNYAVLYIEQFDLNKSASKITHKSFAIIPKNPYQFLSITDDVKIIKNFTPAIPRLAKLKISFLDRYGNPYDFQNMDHRIEILFTSYRQRRKYMDIFGN